MSTVFGTSLRWTIIGLILLTIVFTYFRVLEDTTIVYDLKNKYFYKTARFPESIQSPAICIHYDSVYGAGVRNIYKYEIVNERATWVNLLETDIRASYMISYKEYIYCSQNYFTYLYRFRPGFDQKLERVVSFHEPPVGFINMGKSIIQYFSEMVHPAIFEHHNLKKN